MPNVLYSNWYGVRDGRDLMACRCQRPYSTVLYCNRPRRMHKSVDRLVLKHGKVEQVVRISICANLSRVVARRPCGHDLDGMISRPCVGHQSAKATSYRRGAVSGCETRWDILKVDEDGTSLRMGNLWEHPKPTLFCRPRQMVAYCCHADVEQPTGKAGL